MIQGPKFKSEQYQQLFDENGFVKISDFLSVEQISLLKELYQSVAQQHEQIPISFVSTSHSNDRALIKVVNEGIVNVLSKKLHDVFTDFEILFSNFLLKKAIPKSVTHFHEDVTIVDESQFLSFSIWFPLSEVSETNGSMYFVPKSHLFPTYFRTNPYNKSPYRNLQDLLWDFKEVVNCKSGEAVVFAHKTIHGSFENQSSEDRIAGVLAMYPKGADLYHYHLYETEKKVECYQMELEDFIHLDKSKAPQNAPLLNTTSWENRVYTHKEILGLLGQNYWIYQLKKWI